MLNIKDLRKNDIIYWSNSSPLFDGDISIVLDIKIDEDKIYVTWADLSSNGIWISNRMTYDQNSAISWKKL